MIIVYYCILQISYSISQISTLQHQLELKMFTKHKPHASRRQHALPSPRRTMHCQWGWLSSFCFFVPGDLDLWPLTLTFELGRDLCTAHLNTKFDRPMFSRSEVMVRTIKQTNQQTDTHAWKHHRAPLCYTGGQMSRRIYSLKSSSRLIVIVSSSIASNCYSRRTLAPSQAITVDYSFRSSSATRTLNLLGVRVLLILTALGWYRTVRVAQDIHPMERRKCQAEFEYHLMFELWALPFVMAVHM